MQITSDGTVFGTPDPAVIQDTHDKQTLFNTKMVHYRLKNDRPELIINFRTKFHMPTVYMTAGMFAGLVNIEVMTPSFVVVSMPYRTDDDVERFGNHFRDIWQMTRSFSHS